MHVQEPGIGTDTNRESLAIGFDTVQGSCRVSGSLLIRGEDSGLGRTRSGGGLDGRAGDPLLCGGAAAGAAGLATGATGRATGSADLGSRLPRGE